MTQLLQIPKSRRAGVQHWVPDELQDALRTLVPEKNLVGIVKESLKHLPKDLVPEVMDALSRSWTMESELHIGKVWGGELKNFSKDFGFEPGELEWLGCVCKRVVTNNGVALIVDTFDNTVATGDCRYHGIGTGVTAEAVGDSALVTELTTEYNPNSTRATGTFSQPAANQSRSVATNTLDSGTPAITEHGVFTQAATGGGTLLDRSVFSAINLNGTNGDGIQSTYTITLTAGS